MFITKTHLPRRTVLRGMGTALALPLLDAMVPALSALSRTAAAPVRRAAWFYVPNGMSMRHWLPAKEGALTGDLPMILGSLTPHRDDLVVLSNLAHMTAYPREGDPACDHARSGATYLTGVHADPDLVNPVTDVSVDQRVALETGARGRSWPRSSWGSRCGPVASRARSATPAPIARRSPIAPRRWRCRWRSIRARCSSGCSGWPTARTASRAWRASRATRACSIRSPTRSRT